MITEFYSHQTKNLEETLHEMLSHGWDLMVIEKESPSENSTWYKFIMQKSLIDETKIPT